MKKLKTLQVFDENIMRHSIIRRNLFFQVLLSTLLSRVFLASTILILFVAIVAAYFHRTHRPVASPNFTQEADPKQALQEKTILAKPSSPAPHLPSPPNKHHKPLSESTDKTANIYRPGSEKKQASPGTAAVTHTKIKSQTASTQKRIELNLPKTKRYIAILIDDLGYNLEQGMRFVDLPFELSYAIIPFSPHGEEIANRVHQADKMVMLHAPMATLNTAKWEHGITPNMPQEEVEQLLEKMLKDIPHVEGVNNHGGSLLTQTTRSMEFLLDSLYLKELFFIDSRTSAKSVAREVASHTPILFNQRDVFLDNERSEAAISRQLNKLVKIATKHQYAIGIGHPHPETLAVLSRELPKLRDAGIEVIRASELVKPVKRIKNYPKK